MIWTALCAICIACRDIWNPLGLDNVVVDTTNSFYALWAGTALMGGTLFLEYRSQGRPFLSTPGSWILITNSLVTAALWLNRICFQFFDDISNYTDWIASLPLSIAFGACAVLNGFAYSTYKKHRGWNSVFALSAIQCGLSAWFYSPIGILFNLASTAYVLSIVIFAIAEATLLVTVVAELACGTRRDWVHWASVLLELASVPLFLGNWIGRFYA